MPKAKTAPSSSIAAKLAELRKKDATLRIGSLADFDMNSKNSFSTGNLSLDNAIGVGGFPRGRVVELFGQSQSGKTTSALQAAGVLQKKIQAGEEEGAIVFLDYERSLDEKYCAALGLDVHDADTFIYVHPTSFEQGANAFRSLLDAGLIRLGIADSVAAMVSEKELGAVTGAATMGDRAKAMHQFMRQITGSLYDNDCTLIMLNHVMDVLDISPMGQRMAAQGIKRKTSPGGTALPFYSSVRIEFKQTGTHKSTVYNPVSGEDEDIVTATTVEAKVVKNKVSKPQRIAKMRVRFGKGFSQPYSVFQVLLAYKVIKKSGSWLKVPAEFSPSGEDWQVQGEETIVRELETNADWFKKMESKAQELVDNYTPDQETDDFDIDPNIDPETGEIRE